MKLLYISRPSFFDMDLSLIQYLSKKVDLYFLIDLPPYALKSTALIIKKQHKAAAIFNAENYSEFSEFGRFIELPKTYIINRLSEKTYSLSNLRLQFSVIKFIKAVNPDIIHCNNFMNFNFFFFLLTNRKPILLTVHDPFPHSGDNSLKDSLIRKLNYLFIKRIILLNSSQKQEFIRTNTFKESNIFISSLGVYTYLNEYTANVSQNDTNSILFFGRISPYKGLDYLLQAFEIAKEEIPNLKLTIAGNGNFYFNIKQFNNNPNINIINRYIPIQELVSLLKETKFVICPYTDATQSGVIMTAFALCKPVIATKVGGLAEILDDGITGILVPPKNAEALAEAIQFLLKDEILLSIMRKNIADIYYSGKRSWDSITDNAINIYYYILKQKTKK